MISRVFPLPACPAIATARPAAPVACHAARSAASSVSRPTSGQIPGPAPAAPAALALAPAALAPEPAPAAASSAATAASAARGSGSAARTTEGAGGGPSRPARTSSYSRVVSGSGRTARSRSSTRTSDRYCRMAAERWPAQPCSLMIA